MLITLKFSESLTRLKPMLSVTVCNLHCPTVGLRNKMEHVAKQISQSLRAYLREIQEEHPDFPHDQLITVNFANLLGETPLHVAARRGDGGIASEMIQAGADVNARGEGGYRPLHYAAEQGHFQLVKLLISKGANPTYLTDSGEPARLLAEESGASEIVEFLRRS